MIREANFEQLTAIMNLREGDKVLLTNGQTAEFIRSKQKKFIGIIDGSRYDIPMTMYKETIEKVDVNKKIQEKKQNNNSILSNLNPGDYFYINKNGSALAFKFKEIKGNKIIGINPIDGTLTRIDINFQVELLK